MPLRDHFRPPLNKHHKWSELHGGWPMMLVQQLYPLLPAGYIAAPTVYFGQFFELDVSALEIPNSSIGTLATEPGDGGTALATAPEPTLTLEADTSDHDEFEVRIYDTELDRKLVAAIEIVSPSNKDRPDRRRDFVVKVAALLQMGVCVSVVDLVTVHHFNMYASLLELIGRNDPRLGPDPPCLCSFTIRPRKRLKMRSLLDMWYYPMALGQPLPTLPIWLKSDVHIPLPIGSSYEETCRLLHISLSR